MRRLAERLRSALIPSLASMTPRRLAVLTLLAVPRDGRAGRARPSVGPAAAAGGRLDTGWEVELRPGQRGLHEDW